MQVSAMLPEPETNDSENEFNDLKICLPAPWQGSKSQGIMKAHPVQVDPVNPELIPRLEIFQIVMILYIRVSVVLSQSPARKERQKLDITLDSTVFVCRGKEI